MRGNFKEGKGKEDGEKGGKGWDRTLPK